MDLIIRAHIAMCKLMHSSDKLQPWKASEEMDIEVDKDHLL